MLKNLVALLITVAAAAAADVRTNLAAVQATNQNFMATDANVIIGGSGGTRTWAVPVGSLRAWLYTTANTNALMLSSNLNSTAGPAGITNGNSAFWNSNGIATYLRGGPVGYVTNKDVLIMAH